MSLTLKRDPVWLDSLELSDANEALATMIGDDGCHVSVPTVLLLAASPLLRSISAPSLCLCHICISVPSASGDVLQAVKEIIQRGRVELSYELIGKVTEVFKLLAVEAVLENIGSDILIGIEDGHTIDIMENSDVQTKVKEECLIEMGIKFEKEDGEPSHIMECDGGDYGSKHTSNLNDAQIVFWDLGLFKYSNPHVKMKRMKNLEQIQDVMKTNQCEKTFIQKWKVTKHVDKAHSKCEVCGKNFSMERHLRRHIESLHQMKIFSCEKCNKTFNWKSNLDRHIDKIHMESERSDCQECDKTFTQNYSLKRHVESEHRGMKKFICDICGKDFTLKQGLTRHIECRHQRTNFHVSKL